MERLEYITDIELAAFLVAKGYPCLNIVPIDNKICQFGFEIIPLEIYQAFAKSEEDRETGRFKIPPELEGIRAYRHLTYDAGRKLRGGGQR